MKAAPTAAILRIFNEEGLGIDASSVFEVERAVKAGLERNLFPEHTGIGG